MTAPLRIAVLGASGYTGADLVRLALTHPRIAIAALSANAKAGQTMAAIWPHFAPYPGLPTLVKAEDIDWTGIDAVFGCLPHATSAELLSGIKGPKIIDLSADFRLKDADTYAHWYGGAHPAPHLLPNAVYGLTEFARAALPGANLVACPGCYPTAVLLALLPLLQAGAISPERITVNALSGVSGAGRSLKEANLFPEVAEAVHPYGIGHHRHMPEMEQELGLAAGRPVTMSFTPHLVPMNRGELVTCIVETERSIAELRAILDARYAAEPFVHLLPVGVAPATRMVRGSNHTVINVFADRVPGRAIVIAAIDNLVKGSSGQAIQNFNLMFGLRETMGLEQAPLFPVITTERLIIRPWQESDRAPFAAMGRDPEVMANLGPLMSRDQADAGVDRQIALQESLGHCFWALELRETGAFLGFCGLKMMPEGIPGLEDTLEIGWRLKRDAWGKGYAREAAEASLRWGWDNLPDDRIAAMTTLSNVRSWGLMERLGMTRRLDLDFMHPALQPDDPLAPHITYETLRP